LEDDEDINCPVTITDLYRKSNNMLLPKRAGRLRSVHCCLSSIRCWSIIFNFI